ncbi:DUF6226 family protein [Mangrovihabitans endophyticus]|nr:DUF6226 family protein [Mangrovihabitans endophyticus]
MEGCEQYSHATDPSRYAVLHDAADQLLDELTDRFMVERREAKKPLAEGPLVRTVRLIPRSPAAAPLSIAFTEFPSLMMRFGRWYDLSLPQCGCDACDEDPVELIGEMRTQIEALAEGGLWERVHRSVGGSVAQARLIGEEFEASQEIVLSLAESRAARREGFAAAVQWAPWVRRP